MNLVPGILIIFVSACGFVSTASSEAELKAMIIALQQDLEAIDQRLDGCTCASGGECAQITQPCKRRCCPVHESLPLCMAMAGSSEKKCCLASGERCTDVKKNGIHQCCDPAETCILKGSLTRKTCAKPSNGTNLQVGESCKDHKDSCVNLKTGEFDQKVKAICGEIGTKKELKCCIGFREICSAVGNSGDDQCCNPQQECRIFGVFPICEQVRFGMEAIASANAERDN